MGWGGSGSPQSLRAEPTGQGLGRLAGKGRGQGGQTGRATGLLAPSSRPLTSLACADAARRWGWHSGSAGGSSGAGSWGCEAAIRYGGPQAGGMRWAGATRQAPNPHQLQLSPPFLLPLGFSRACLSTASFPRFRSSHFKPSAPRLIPSLLSLSPDWTTPTSSAPLEAPPSNPSLGPKCLSPDISAARLPGGSLLPASHRTGFKSLQRVPASTAHSAPAQYPAPP